VVGGVEEEGRVRCGYFVAGRADVLTQDFHVEPVKVVGIVDQTDPGWLDPPSIDYQMRSFLRVWRLFAPERMGKLP